MKRFVAVLFLLAFAVCQAQQPVMRNAMTTNIAGTPVLSVNNLSVTNSVAGGSTNWLFYGILPSTVARLSDISSPTSGITSAQATNIVIALGTNWFILQTNGYGTNTALVNPTLTNGINYGNAFSSVGSGVDSQQYGAGAIATNAESVALGNSSVAGGSDSIALGYAALSFDGLSSAVGANSAASYFGTALGSSAIAGTNSVTVGSGSITTGSNSVSIGAGILNIADNSFVLGLDNHAVSIPGFLELPRNAGLNRVWSCTNATTGRGTWVALSPPPPSPPTDYVTNNNGWGTNMVDWGTNFTSMSNLLVGGSLYVSNGVWITNIDNLAQLLYVNSAGTNLSAYLGTNVYIEGGSGDFNGSGGITTSDVTNLKNYLRGTATYGIGNLARGNLLGDNVISATDAYYIRQYLLGIFSSISEAKNYSRRMKGRAWQIDLNGFNRFGYIYAGDLDNIRGVVEITSGETTNPPALFVINTNKFFVDTNGWVGIGTNLPQAALHVYSNSIFDGSVQLGWVTGSKLAEFDANRLLTNSAYSSTELTNPLATITYTDTKQYGSANLTNWSGVATSAVLYPWGGQWGSTTLSNLAATGALTNVNEVQYGCANLTNWCQISTNDFISGTTVSNAIAAQTYGQTWYVWGSSNVTSVTNYLGTNYKAMQKSDVTLSTTANTNVYVNPAVNDYIGEVITAIPAGISSITPGDITSVSFAFISGGGSMSLLAEVYIRTNLLAYTNSNEREIGVGPTFALSTSLAAYQTAIPITTNVSLSTTNYLVRKLKVVSKSGTPNVSLVSQGAYPARVTFPIGSASFVLKSGDTMSGSLVMNSGQFIGNGGGLTNVPGDSLTWTTNALASTNSMNMALDSRIIIASGTISISNCLNTSATEVKKAGLLIDANGADRILRIPDWVKTTDGLRTWTVTNGIRGYLYMETYGQLYTNASYTPLY